MSPDSASTTTSTTSLLVGIDIGGTFTDFVVYHPQTGVLETFKVLSTPADPAQAVLQGLTRLGKLTGDRRVVHGSTVATNALLERKGARTALVTTRGFRDVLEIGRQNRPALYALQVALPPPLVPPELCFEVDERVDRQGRVLQPLDTSQADELAQHLADQGVESAAVCLLFSFLHPEHEQQVAGRLREAGLFVSLSSEVLPEYREYERASTTAVNAYVSPILDRYLSHLEGALAGDSSEGQSPLRVMQSNGGIISPEEARRFGVRCILSGPAGGVVGARYVAAQAESRPGETPRVIGFDMGGTSTDVSLIDGVPQVTSETVVGGMPIRIPVLDIHTIGAGGGSIARVDEGGALRVGPESAGADPGPACYGRGEQPTVTDANLVLGRLDPERFLGGKMRLHPDRAEQALRRLAEPLGLSVQQAALGVVEVANAHMERALRVISVERGHDPRRFHLLSFGGAGGLHAADLARRLGIPAVLAPPLASTLSAFGMLAADVVKDYLLTVMLPGETPLPEISERLEPLLARGWEELLAEGIPAERIELHAFLDMRYRGQSYELVVPFGPDVLRRFHALHKEAYGYARQNAPLEIVNLRVRSVGRVTPPPLQLQPEAGPDPRAALLEMRPVVFPAGKLETPFYAGEALRPGNRITGPAVVVRSDTTILIGPQDEGVVDRLGNLVLTIG